MARTKGATALKGRFLSVFPERKIVSDTCKAIGATRSQFSGWCQSDPEFRKQYESLKLEIIDEARRIAYQKIGLLPDPDAAKKKWVDNNLLMQILRQDPEFKDQTNVYNSQIVTNLEIKGLDMAKLSALAKPDKFDEIPQQINAVHLNGVEQPKHVSPSIQKLRDAAEEKKPEAEP